MPKKPLKWWLALLFLLLASLLLAPAAFAQEEEEEVEALEGEDVVDETYLDEVTVTATKREEPLQEIPIAVTAISETELERANVQDIRQLPLLAPSFNMNSTQTESQGTTLRIRGVGTTGNNIGLESAVGVFVDGVYLSRPGVALGDLLDVQAVEVLRGPQGTLFGRNVSAGLINVRTQQPAYDTSVFANVGAANFSGFNAQAGVTGPVTDSLAYRFSGAYRNRDGFQESTTGAETRNRDRYLLRGQLLWDPSDSTSIRFIGDYSDADEQCCDAPIVLDTPATALGSFVAAGLPADGGAPVTGDFAFENRISNAEQFENPFDQTGFSAEVNTVLNPSTTLTYLGSWRDFRAESIQHSDFVGIPVFAVSPDWAGGFETFDDIESMTHELRVAGDSDRFSWMLGAYYSDEDIVENQGLGLGASYTQYMDAMLWNFAFAPVLPFAPALANVPLATGGTFGDVLAAGNQALAFSGGLDSNGSYANNIFEQNGDSWSLFTHNTWRVTDRFDVVVGLRYVDESKDGRFAQLVSTNQACLNNVFNAAALSAGAAGTGLEAVAATIGGFSAAYACFPFTAPADTGIPILPASFDETFEDDELIYTGKLVYAFTDTMRAYGSYTHGFKSGGFNLDPTAAAGGASPSFDSEKIDSLELGLKSEWLNRKLRLNLSFFDYDIEDFQVLEFTGVQFVTFNVPKAQATGGELDMSWRPIAGLDVNLAYTYSDANYPNDCDNGIQTPTVSTLCGAPLTNAPENVVVGGLAWNSTIGEKWFYFVSGNARYEDDRRTSTQPNLPFDIQEANTKFHARFGFGNFGGNWTIELWGDNITDEQTKNVTFNTSLRIGSRAVYLEAPRTYGLTLRLRY